MLKEQSIGVFDSGLGGTTVLKEIFKILPHENIIYYSDSGNSPYGGRTKEEIQHLCEVILKFLIEHNCKVIVIACNTATAGALEYLRTLTDVPIIGVINGGVKEALKGLKNKKIGVVATEFTVNSKVYENILHSIDSELEVYQSACKEFCPMIEAGWETFPNRFELLEKYMAKIPADSEILILGCTHYPIIKKDFKKYFSGKLIDPSMETALTLRDFLEIMKLLNPQKTRGHLKFYTTGCVENFVRIAEKFLGRKIEKKIEKIDYKYEEKE